MVECEKIRELIIRGSLKDITEDEERLLNEHINECANCRADFIFQSEMDKMLKSRPLMEAPNSIVEKVLSSIPAYRQIYETPRLNYELVLSICCIIIALVVTLGTLYFPLQLDLGVHKLSLIITKYTSLLLTPYFIIGTVVYSIVFSAISFLLFRRNQLIEM